MKFKAKTHKKFSAMWYACSLAPRPCAFVVRSTKFMRTASDERAGPGNEASMPVLSEWPM